MHRYSDAFKQQVLSELERGELGMTALCRKYSLNSPLVYYWIKRMGKFELSTKIVRVEKPDERDRVKELERQIHELKEALADTQVQCLIAESRLEIVCEQQGLDVAEVKKKLKSAPSNKQSEKE